MTLEEITYYIETEIKEDEFYGADCDLRRKAHIEILDCLEELQDYKEAWERLHHDVYELHSILFNMKPDHRTTTVAGDILRLIETYRPKERDN